MAWTKALSVFSCDVPFLPGLVHSRVTVRIFGGPISAFSCATATAPSANKHVPNISPIGFIGNLLCGFEKQPPFYADLVFWQRLPWQGSVGPTTRYSMQTKTHIRLRCANNSTLHKSRGSGAAGMHCSLQRLGVYWFAILARRLMRASAPKNA